MAAIPSRELFNTALKSTLDFCVKNSVTVEELMWQTYKSLPTNVQVNFLFYTIETLDRLSKERVNHGT
jgi:hypothetical protein